MQGFTAKRNRIHIHCNHMIIWFWSPLQVSKEVCHGLGFKGMQGFTAKSNRIHIHCNHMIIWFWPPPLQVSKEVCHGLGFEGHATTYLFSTEKHLRQHSAYEPSACLPSQATSISPALSQARFQRPLLYFSPQKAPILILITQD
jgi:predicted membrane protein